MRSSKPGVRFQMSEEDPDYPAMLLASYIFGGPITSHMSDRIRNREGLSYGANARVAIPTEGDDALLSGTVSLNPMNGPKVEFSFTDELARTLRRLHGTPRSPRPRRPTWTRGWWRDPRMPRS